MRNVILVSEFVDNFLKCVVFANNFNEYFSDYLYLCKYLSDYLYFSDYFNELLSEILHVLCLKSMNSLI